MEHDEQTEEMEHDAQRMEHESERVGEHIDEARKEWEEKEQDPSVPGAQPDPSEEETATGNPAAAGAEGPDSDEDE